MSTRERASLLLDLLTEDELDMFIYLFGDKHKIQSDAAESGESGKKKDLKRLEQVFKELGEECFPNGREPQFQAERESL